jgi:hypothetical protein
MSVGIFSTFLSLYTYVIAEFRLRIADIGKSDFYLLIFSDQFINTRNQ